MNKEPKRPTPDDASTLITVGDQLPGINKFTLDEPSSPTLVGNQILTYAGSGRTDQWGTMYPYNSAPDSFTFSWGETSKTIRLKNGEDILKISNIVEHALYQQGIEFTVNGQEPKIHWTYKLIKSIKNLLKVK